MVIKLGEG